MNLNDMLFAYGKGKSNVRNAKLDLKRNSLSRSLSESVLLGEAEFLDEQRIMKENIVNNFGIGRTRTRMSILRDRNSYKEKLTEALLINTIFDIFNEALLLDDPFKETYRGNLFNLTESTFTSMIKEKGLSIKDLKKQSCSAMAEIIEECENYAEKEAIRMYPLNEEKTYKHDKLKPIEIDLGVEGDFHCDVEFNCKNISSLVRSKVVSVIADEKKKVEDEEEFKLSIEDKLDPADGIDDEEILDDIDGEDMNEASEEDTAASAIPANGKPMENQAVVEKAMKDQKNEAFKHNFKRKRKLTENTLFNALTLGIAKKNVKELSEAGTPDIELDMNMVFAESIAHYTLLETLYTTKLLDVDAKEARTLATSLLV